MSEGRFDDAFWGRRWSYRTRTSMDSTAGLFGGLWGLIAALIIGGLRIANSELPQLRAEWVGDLAFAMVYLAPFLLAVLAVRWVSPALRASAWGAAGVIAALAVFTSFSGVSLLFLPAAALLIIAGLLAIKQAGSDRAGLALLLSLVLVVFVTGAWWTLFSQEDGRCWELIRTADGVESWFAAPYGEHGTISASGTGRVAVTCTSDVITPGEGVLSLALLIVGGTVFALARPRLEPERSG